MYNTIINIVMHQNKPSSTILKYILFIKKYFKLQKYCKIIIIKNL